MDHPGLESALQELRTASDAQAADAISNFVRLAAEGIDRCISLLLERSYVFQGQPIGQLTEQDHRALDQYRDQMPPLVLAIWEHVGTVDLRGTLPEPPFTSNGFDRWHNGIDPDLRQRLRKAAKVYYADQLQIDGPYDALREYFHTVNIGEPQVELSGDACVKAGYGGGNPTAVVVSAESYDPTVTSPEWAEGTTLGGLLVESLRWGGLPGLRTYPKEIAIAILGEAAPV